MPQSDEPVQPDCYMCKIGRFNIRVEEIAFSETTDRGDIHVRIAIPMSVCDHCGYRTWGAAEEELINDAVLREYHGLPKP
ncbi:MAG TPA: hypothetical protein VEJ16_05190 [Alphaproteobacteria bacterium]|nr:hypothetical protein [Alphaproteobacteria bacterium]